MTYGQGDERDQCRAAEEHVMAVLAAVHEALDTISDTQV